VLKSREFLDELAKIYHSIKKSYLKFFKRKTGEEPAFITKKRGTVAIFLAANEFFYGTLILDIWSRAYDFWKNNKTDLLVIGRLGNLLHNLVELRGQVFDFFLELDTKQFVPQ
jgi:hypothetical protein